MNTRSRDRRPMDPRDQGGRNESGQNPDTQIDIGQRMEGESESELKQRFKGTTKNPECGKSYE